MPAHEVVDGPLDGLEGIALVARDEDLRIAFAPEAGMVGCSMTHRGEELLGQRGGLAAYRARGSTFGIPFLYPWANRLAGFEYSVGGRRVELDPARSPVRLDGHGLPIHGLMAASPYWHVDERSAADGWAAIGARLDFAAHDELMAAFPFPHELRHRVELAGNTVTAVTTVTPTGDVAVPVAFGWHPYLRLPGVPRSRWRVELPVRSRAVLDERGLPTGQTEPAAIEPGPLGERTYDDLFPELERPPVFAVEGGGRRIELELGEGYAVAQVFAPGGEELVCFEPMTAPTNALVSGDGVRSAPPGGGFRAEFRLRVLG